ncbi:MAG TPA: serine/threonine-protein kinase [Polyangia bacterium]|jgi:serine/threonine-protein kinase|nr:serine/threonine-protein kinase [Polyangia bacterium]
MLQETQFSEDPAGRERRQLGPYQLVRMIGQGGMGAVYEAVHTVIGRRVAIKTLGRAYAALPGAVGRFLREAQVTSRLRHPHIVDVTDLGFEDGVCFLVMEYLDGEDLDQRLSRGQLSVDETVEIGLPIIAAVATAHQHGVIHRDIKPHNIFLTRGAGGSLHPKVLDFGISKSLGASVGTVSIGAGGGLIGSPCYLAPEQLEQGKGATLATDQYALGVLLYECLTGQTPFDGDDLSQIFHNILTGTYTPPRSLCPDIPPGVQQVIARAMSLGTDDRYPSVKDLGRALLVFATPKVRLNWEPAFFEQPEVAATAAVTPVATSLGRSRRDWRWSPWAGLAIATLTALSTAALGIALLPEPRPHRHRPAVISTLPR